MKAKIKAEVKRLGFALSGICLPHPSQGFDAFQAWIEGGYHAEMRYLAREDTLAKRANPQLLLEDCQSVVCVALPYPNPKNGLRAENERLRGSVSAYARVADYHSVIKAKLEALASFIELQVGDPLRYFVSVDSSAVLEKSYAYLAGLGQVGKNGLLWNEELGTWFFLGELFLDLELDPDSPIEGDFCGDCDICIHACPTGALLRNRTLDASRCLSYLTIEHRGAVPADLRGAFGQRVFGCDTCQLVCPKNNPTLPVHFRYENQTVLDDDVDLVEALKLTEEDFKARYKGTSLMRAKYQGFRRNVIIALGNSADLEALMTLRRVIAEEQDPICIESMQWAIKKLEDSFSAKA